ncbi:carbohydrate ABC transporter permease [Paenibacillus arenilitoris]|uniref:Carbohydrate ABC transporter permease n=1 Tax=Paenibacillus arenilitoris TaxID=2772299 RepID=A0A927H5H4_9BACL|nr:carbohydrate ABC transporter permease [Paenibacillus arenilitoris]MBD2868955.1 carbohydrate ABC transporter permease [Paenibacillus arenilitoris]
MNILESKQDKWFLAANYAALFLILVNVLYPLLYILSSSLSSPQAVVSGRVWVWPVEFTLDGYKVVMEYEKFWLGFANSMFYTGVGTFLNVVVTIMAAYALSRKDLPFGVFILSIFVFTTLFQAGLIPEFLVVDALGIMNTRWAMIFPTALSVFQLLVARTFFEITLPEELLKAAQVDGASDLTFFFKIALPLSAPIIAVLSLFYAVGHWNQYFMALIYLRDESLFPVQIFLRNVLVQNEVDSSLLTGLGSVEAQNGLRQLLKYSVIVIASAPMLIVYPFLQKYLVKGALLGSIKS